MTVVSINYWNCVPFDLFTDLHIYAGIWTIYREIDDGAITERGSHNAVQNLLRVFIDDRHHFVNDDNLWPAENNSSQAQQLHTMQYKNYQQ